MMISLFKYIDFQQVIFILWPQEEFWIQTDKSLTFIQLNSCRSLYKDFCWIN